MKSKWSGLVLVLGMLAPGAVFAGDSNPDVGKAIAEIAARRDAKADAEAKAAAAYATREGNEGRSNPFGAGWTGQPGASVRGQK